MRDKLGRFVGKGKEEIICKYCNKKFFNYISSNKKFCSKICDNEWRKEGYKGENNPFYGKQHTKKVRDIISNIQFKTPFSQRILNHCKLCDNIINKSERESWKCYKQRKFCCKKCSSKYNAPFTSPFKKGVHPNTEFKKGENHIFFNNWSSLEPYGLEFNKKIKELIKGRDGCCLMCNIGFNDLQLLKRKIHVHHVDYNKQNNFIQNFVILCNSCHSKTNTNRIHWTKFFQSLLSEKYGYKYSEEGHIKINLNK